MYLCDGVKVIFILEMLRLHFCVVTSKIYVRRKCKSTIPRIGMLHMNVCEFSNARIFFASGFVYKIFDISKMEKSHFFLEGIVIIIILMSFKKL